MTGPFRRFGGYRGRWVGAGVFAAVAVAAGAFAVANVGRDGDSPRGGRGPRGSAATIDPASLLDGDARALIGNATPSPECAGVPAEAPADGSVVPLDVVRVVDGCFAVTTEYVPADEVDSRRATLAEDATVVAAAVTPVPVVAQEDERRDDQWGLDAVGASDDAELPWPDGTGATVAVLDTGIDATHPELADAVVGRRRYPGEDPERPDPAGHGTHSAGIIAARAGDGGIVGVAPGVSILDVPVAIAQDGEVVNQGAGRSPQSVAAGIEWAVNHGADVINMSFGFFYDFAFDPDDPESVAQFEGFEAMAAAVGYAAEHRVIMVASAGNGGKIRGCEEDEAGLVPDEVWFEVCTNEPPLPARFADVIAVGAVDRDLEFRTSSSRWDLVALSAPGEGILSSVPGGYDNYSGTSPAAPFVTAAAAIARAEVPDISPAAVREALVETAVPLGGEERFDDDNPPVGAGAGLLNIPGMLDAVHVADPGGPEDRGTDADPLVAYRADTASTLAVVNAASGQQAVLARVEGSMGIPANPLWSPTGRRLAGRTRGGTVTVWDTDALLFRPGDLGEGPPAEPMATLTYPSGSPGCIVDFVFVDDASIVALEAPGFMDGSSCGPVAGTQLRTYDIASGVGDDPVTAPPLDDLVGVLDDGSILASAEAGPESPATFAWLDPSGNLQKTVEVAGTAGFGAFLEPLLSPDGRSVAQVVRADNGVTDIVVLDLEEGTATTTPLPEASNGETVQGLRWADADTLVASLEITGTVAPSTPGDHRLWALRDGEWHQLDGNPLVAGRAVGDRTQVVVSAAEEIINDGWAYGGLYVLHDRPYGDAGDVYAAPGERDAPLATGVDEMWPSPAGAEEQPFLLD